MAKAIANVQLVTPSEEVRPVSISFTEAGTIASILEGSSPNPGDEIILDGGGDLSVFAGFIDIHTHGANGVDISHATPKAIRTFAEAKLAEGVTTFLPTTWTASVEHLEEMVRAAVPYFENQEFARTPSFHIEGPYLNTDQAGAQDPNYMRVPDVAEIDRLASICPISLISVAIELEGGLDFVREMKSRGIVTSAAHSEATYAEFCEARLAGLGNLTHYCNQMSRLHHREIGLVGAALLDDEVMIEMICDKVHLCPEMIELAFKHRSLDRIMLITDSIAASHLGDGNYPLGDTEIIVQNGEARIPEGNLAGSIVLFNDLIKNVAEVTALSLPEIATCSAANQAKMLGLNDRGSIQEGLLADLTLLDQNFDVAATIIGGEIRFQRA